MHKWVSEVTQRIKEDITDMEAAVTSGIRREANKQKIGHRALVPEADLLLYLQLLPPEKLALITVVESMRTVGMSRFALGAKTATMMSGIGKGVEAEHQVELIRTNFGAHSKHFQRLLEEISVRNRSAVRQTWSKIGHRLDETDGEDAEAVDAAQAAAAAVERDPKESWSKWRDVWTPSWSSKTYVDVGGYLLNHLIKTAKVQRTEIDPVSGEEL